MIVPNITETSIAPPSGGDISFRFDFAKGDFEVLDGKVTKITEQELVKNKIEKLLRTEYAKYAIYTVYGMPYHNWIYGQRDRELIRLALTRELTERIPDQVAHVRRIYAVEIIFDKRALTAKFTVESDFTTEEVTTWIQY